MDGYLDRFSAITSELIFEPLCEERLRAGYVEPDEDELVVWPVGE